MSALMDSLQNLRAELQANARLRLGLILIGVVLLVDGGLRWSDAIARQQQTLVRLQSDVAALKKSVRNESELKGSYDRVKLMQKQLDTRLWTVSSEAVGQARLKDWLIDVVKRSIADQYAVTLSASREIGKPEALNPSAQAPEANSDGDGLREFRANVSFRLTPKAIEGVLSEIEGGEPFSAIESLIVKGQERRVEMTIRVLMRVKAAGNA